jgi:hypothetical protein
VLPAATQAKGNQLHLAGYSSVLRRRVRSRREAESEDCERDARVCHWEQSLLLPVTGLWRGECSRICATKKLL